MARHAGGGAVVCAAGPVTLLISRQAYNFSLNAF
jgi:hypothetical protein